MRYRAHWSVFFKRWLSHSVHKSTSNSFFIKQMWLEHMYNHKNLFFYRKEHTVRSAISLFHLFDFFRVHLISDFMKKIWGIEKNWIFWKIGLWTVAGDKEEEAAPSDLFGPVGSWLSLMRGWACGVNENRDRKRIDGEGEKNSHRPFRERQPHKTAFFVNQMAVSSPQTHTLYGTWLLPHSINMRRVLLALLSQGQWPRVARAQCSLPWCCQHFDPKTLRESWRQSPWLIARPRPTT